MEILWGLFLSITFPTNSLTSVSSSYVDSCKALVSPTDDYLVTVVNYYSVSPSSSVWITGYYVVYEAILVPVIE